MGFQEPPTLPDYSKLVFMLNNSGVQKWNPAVYDILKNLIAAVQQSQGTLVDSTIADVVNNNIRNGTIIIPAVGGGGSIMVSDFTITGGPAKTLFSAPVQIVPAAGPGTVILPVKAYIHCAQPATYFFTRNADLAYDVIPSTPPAISILGQITQIQTNAIQDVVKVYEPNNLSSGALATITNKPIWLQGAADNNVGGFDPGNANSIIIRLFSILTTAI
jgi:hypothetical protein